MRERVDLKLTDFLAELTADCPRSNRNAFNRRDRRAARSVWRE
jgi:hypothetical protein